MSKIKTMPKNPPKNAELTAQLRWFLRHANENPLAIAGSIDIHSSTLYRFLAGSRGLSDGTTDRLARHLRLRLIQDVK